MSSPTAQSARVEAKAAELMATVRARVKFQSDEQPQSAPEQTQERAAWLVSSDELEQSLQAREAVRLPDFVDDVLTHLDSQRRQERQEHRQRNAERLAELLTAQDWTDADAEQAAQLAAQAREAATEPPAPRVRVQQYPGQPSAADLLAEALPVSAQARALFHELHELATLANHHAGTHRAGQGVVYTSQQLLGEALDGDGHSGRGRTATIGRSGESVRRYANELEAAGLVQRRDHYSTHKGRTLTDGTLYAVQTRPGHTPRLRYGHLSRQYRSLDEAKRTGTTFFSYLLNLWESSPGERRNAAKCVLKHFVVNPDQVPPPVMIDSHKTPSSVWDVIYSLSELAALNGARLAEAIGRAGYAIADHLNDSKSRRYWCAQLWQALRGHRLQQFTAALERVLHDAEEWTELRNPAALFAARMRPTI